jgi:glycosyltransferase involved in cell wall biosynthesis
LVGPVLGYQRHLEELHRLVEDQNLTEWVIFSEERQDIPEILRAVDVVVLPTVIPEGLGKVLLEGLACGKPVIATNQGGPLEILRDCAAARLVPPRDSTAIAQALQYFWELPPARQQELSQEGYELVKQQYSMSKMIENLEEVYNSLLSS